jgi:hypothetical protein
MTQFSQDTVAIQDAEAPGTRFRRGRLGIPGRPALLFCALFASGLRRSDAPAAASVAEAISRVVRRSGTRGCAVRMAQEHGDHPLAAAERMRWVRQDDRPAARQPRPWAARPVPSRAGHGMTYHERGSGDERDV